MLSEVPQDEGEGLSEFEIERLENLRGTRDVMVGGERAVVSVWHEGNVVKFSATFVNCLSALMGTFDQGYEF